MKFENKRNLKFKNLILIVIIEIELFFICLCLFHINDIKKNLGVHGLIR